MRFAVVVDTTIELCQQIVDCTMEQRNLLCRHLPHNGVIDRVTSVGYLIPHVYKTTKIRNGRGCPRVQFMSLIKCFTYDLEKLVQYELETAIVSHRLDSLACRESFDF